MCDLNPEEPPLGIVAGVVWIGVCVGLGVAIVWLLARLATMTGS